MPVTYPCHSGSSSSLSSPSPLQNITVLSGQTLLEDIAWPLEPIPRWHFQSNFGKSVVPYVVQSLC